jgi:futalosine hydrolase
MSRFPDICSMYILLAAATTFEIQPTIDFLTQSVAGQERPETSSLITGIGPLSTSWSLMRQVVSRRPDLIIQAGIAGSFTPYPAGEVLAVKEDSLADLGVWEDQRFKTTFDLGLAEPNQPPFTRGQLINPYEQLLGLTGLEQVKAITVNEISTDPHRIKWYQQNCAPVVESMEGAALHFICLQEGIPFLQLRSVSNDIGERDKKKWEIRTAIQQLNSSLINLLGRLEDQFLHIK